MSRHVVAPASEVPPGEKKLFHVKGRAIAVFNIGGEFFGMLDRCPHQGGSLSAGIITGLMQSPAPGQYTLARRGEIVRCPWHGWEFDIRTGQSHCDPDRVRSRAYTVKSEPGAAVLEGPYVAETVQVRIEEEYIVVDM